MENPELPAALVRQARLLRSCLQVYSAAYDEGLLNARDGSPAHMDFQQAEHGPTGKPWPDYFAAGPRDSAITLIRAQADFSSSVGILLEAGQVFEPVYSLARSALEFGARSFWLLDPGASLRQRCARHILMELVSIHYVHLAARSRPDLEERRSDTVTTKAQAKTFKRSLPELFNDVQLADDPGKWSIEGIAYEGWTSVAERCLGQAPGAPSGRWIYDHLSMRAHPQGLIVTPGFEDGKNAGNRSRSTDGAELSRLGGITVFLFYQALRRAAEYHGLESAAIAELGASMAIAFPRAPIR